MPFSRLRAIMTAFFTIGKKMQIRTILIGIALTLPLINCASYDFSRRVVQQGNLLPQSKIERLKVGMSKDDVAILMGTSLLSPTFNNDRWDYAYTRKKGSSLVVVRHLSLYFNHGTLARIEQ